MRNVKIVLSVAAIVQFASLCAVLGVMFMQKALLKRQMMYSVHKDSFVVPYASLITAGLSLLMYVIVFCIVVTAGEESSRVKAVISLICLAVLKILCSYVGTVVNMVVVARNSAKALALHSVVESYASMWSSPFALVALILFCFGMGQYYESQDR
ncbi:MAG: hypothetical protein IJ716_10780 [Lachnospiraceae bacterium]|nr:hypothetical protein [Lachnospiraceae bacterium]